MRLRPGAHVLWRREGVSQVHADPELAVVLDGLTVEEQRFLDGLSREAGEASVLARGRDLGIRPARVRELLERVEASGALERARDPSVDHHGLGAELDHWSRATGRDASDLLARRRKAVVAVLGLGRLGMLLAGGLAAAGVGTLLMEDAARVRRDDVGLGGYGLPDIGARRGDRARGLLRLDHPHLRTSAPPRTRPDLVVLVEQDVSDPVRLRPLVREDVAHLLVVARSVDVVVGPLVTPGRGPCGRCVELHRTDEDDRWPALATQLLGAPARGVEATAALIAAGAAVGQVLAHLDGRPVAVSGASLVLDPRRPVAQTRQWPVHPECGCTGLPARAGAAVARA